MSRTFPRSADVSVPSIFRLRQRSMITARPRIPQPRMGHMNIPPSMRNFNRPTSYQDAAQIGFMLLLFLLDVRFRLELGDQFRQGKSAACVLGRFAFRIIPAAAVVAAECLAIVAGQPERLPAPE